MKFTLGQILNLSDGTLFTSIEDVYALANFITGDNLFTHVLPRAFRYCSPELKRQLPFLESAAMRAKLADFRRWINSLSLPRDPELIQRGVAAWLKDAETEFGLEHEVIAAPDGWKQLNPLEELEAMIPKENIIVVYL